MQHQNLNTLVCWPELSSTVQLYSVMSFRPRIGAAKPSMQNATPGALDAEAGQARRVTQSGRHQ